MRRKRGRERVRRKRWRGERVRKEETERGQEEHGPSQNPPQDKSQCAYLNVSVKAVVVMGVAEGVSVGGVTWETPSWMHGVHEHLTKKKRRRMHHVHESWRR